MRIRNGAKCIEYLNNCPETVKQIFRNGDKGCANRINGTCTGGFEYEFENKNYWKCCCCGCAFCFSPRMTDIPHYIKLSELGIEK